MLVDLALVDKLGVRSNPSMKKPVDNKINKLYSTVMHTNNIERNSCIISLSSTPGYNTQPAYFVN